MRRYILVIMSLIFWLLIAPGSFAIAADTDNNAATPTKDLVDHLKGDVNYHVPPSDEEIPDDKYGDDVRLGKKIFTQTWKYAKRYTGNGLVCSNCHMNAGRQENAAPLWAAYGMYPAYKEKNDRNNTLGDRIQQCFRFSLNGFAPTFDTPEIRALKAYIHFLSRGAPIGIELPGRGYPQVVKTGQDANPTRGGKQYREKCASCHGKDGGGKKNNEGGFQFPPLWGLDSYNKAAGFSRNDLLAGFIKANMPLGQGWSLSDQESLDIASYINLQIRPLDPRKGILEGLLE